MPSVLDLVFGAIILFNLIHGLRRGLIRSVFDIASMIIAIFVAIKWYRDLSLYLLKFIDLNGSIIYALSFVIIWFLAYVVISYFGNLIHKVLGGSIFAPFNILGGAILGFLKGFFMVLIIVQLVILFPLPPSVSTAFKESTIVQMALPIIGEGYKQIYKFIPKDIPNVSRFFERSREMKNKK